MQPEPDLEEQEQELERAVLEEDAYQQQKTLEAQDQEHDALVAEEEAADVERYERHRKDEQAQAAQEWEDWAVFSEMNPQIATARPAGKKRTSLRAMVQQRDGSGKVRRQESFQLLLDEGSTVTMGFQLTSGSMDGSEGGHGQPQPQGEGQGTETAGHVSSSASSTEAYAEGVQLSLGADISEFLGSIPGIHLYNQWSLEAITSAVILHRYGSGVLEAFEAQKVFLESRSEG